MLIFSSPETFCGDEGQRDENLQVNGRENKWENKIKVMNYSYRSTFKNGKMEECLLC